MRRMAATMKYPKTFRNNYLTYLQILKTQFGPKNPKKGKYNRTWRPAVSFLLKFT